MNIIVHLPTNEIQINELKKLVSDVHSEKVISYISNLNLSYLDKEKMIEKMVISLYWYLVLDID